MRQGEVWTLPGRTSRVVVISSDQFNELPGFRPITVPLVRLHDQDAAGLAVATGEPDHIGGRAAILVYAPRPTDPLPGQSDTTLSGQTMSRVVDAIQQLYSY